MITWVTAGALLAGPLLVSVTGIGVSLPMFTKSVLKLPVGFRQRRYGPASRSACERVMLASSGGVGVGWALLRLPRSVFALLAFVCAIVLVDTIFFTALTPLLPHYVHAAGLT